MFYIIQHLLTMYMATDCVK